MYRPLGIEFSGALHHLTARGNACQAIILDHERRDLLGLLGRPPPRSRRPMPGGRIIEYGNAGLVPVLAVWRQLAA